MSSYRVDVTLGSYVFTVLDTDSAAVVHPVYVLDGLRIGWSTSESEPDPVQPEPLTARLALLTADVANLAGVDVGTPGYIKITSAGRTIASFAGRVGDVTATPDRYNGDQVVRYEILFADYTVDLAELPITLSRPVEAGTARLQAIADAIAAAGGATVTVPAFLGAGTSFDALDVAAQPAYDVLVSHLAQIDTNAGASDFTPGRSMLTATTVAGVLTGYQLVPRVRFAKTWGPGTFKLVAGKLTIAFDGAAPPALGGADMGLVVDACEVAEDINYRLSKFGTANTVTVTYAGGDVTVSNRTGDPRVGLRLSSGLLGSADARAMAILYLANDALPDRWSVESFAWSPSDAELAALPFPLTPDTNTGNASCYVAQVAVENVPAAINPANDSPFYAGTLNGVTVSINGGKLTATLNLARRIASAFPDPATGVGYGITIDNVATLFPAVTIDDVDPTISIYESRLVRKPA